MRRRILSFAAIAVLASCSQEPASEPDTADDFASRIGQADAGGQTASGTDARVQADRPNVVGSTIPTDADVTQLQQLGDVGGVDFGPRSGSCTFMDGNREVLMAAGMAEPTMSGKAVIRVGDTLTMLDGQPGGLAAVQRGGTFSAGGVAVQIAPAQGTSASRSANMSVTSADGRSVSYSGNWICS